MQNIEPQKTDTNFQIEQIIRLPEVIKRTGRSRSSIYDSVAKGEFPAPIKLSQRSVGWLESDINVWITTRIMKSRS